MTDAPQSVVYRSIPPEDMDTVRPLWEKLRAYHAQLPWEFAEVTSHAEFEPRKQELLTKAALGKLHIELATTQEGTDVAYCISTVTADGRGEVDSIFVEESFRGHGIGSELLRHALAWLDGAGATSKIVSVAYANQEALALYQRFGFHPRTILLQQKT